MLNFNIGTMQSDDWPAIRNIYSEGIATGYATSKQKLQNGPSGISVTFKIAGWLHETASGSSAGQHSVQSLPDAFIPAWRRFPFTWLLTRGAVASVRCFFIHLSSDPSIAEFGPCKRASFRRIF
jgi:hypothetical protein